MTGSGLPVQVLTIRQPWASLITAGLKDVENRMWRPPQPCLLLIHAGKTHDHDGFGLLASLGITPPPGASEGGLIIGRVELTGWVRDSPSAWAQPGHWHWLLASPVPAARPIPWRGQRRLCPPPDDWQEAFAG